MPERLTPERIAEALALALEIEQHCPCGARPESPNTHPHVMKCPTAKLLKLLGGNSVSVADIYEKAVAYKGKKITQNKTGG